MNDNKNRKIEWIRSVIDQLESHNKASGKEILSNCGSECSKGTNVHQGASAIGKQFNDNQDTDLVFNIFKQRYYNTPLLTKNGNQIKLIFKECTCPLVKEGINNSFICNCTCGYSEEIFTTLFNRPVNVVLTSSILGGDEFCEQLITLL